jgi:hypothetical protein
MPNDPVEALAALRSRLLNLAASNRLLHYPHRDGNLRIVGAAADTLHQRLLAGQELRFQPVPDPTRDELIASGHLVIDPLTGTEHGSQPEAVKWAAYKGLPALVQSGSLLSLCF